MNMWTVILDGLLLVTLGRALDDAGVYVLGTYSQGEFEKRVWPFMTPLACTTLKTDAFEWFRISQWERVLLDFAGGRNNKNETLRLGTPTLHVVHASPDFVGLGICKFLPTAYHNVTVKSAQAHIARDFNLQYFAVKVINTEQASLKKGWDYVTNLVKNRFNAISPMNLAFMGIEITASGEVYVGVMQDFYP